MKIEHKITLLFIITGFVLMALMVTIIGLGFHVAVFLVLVPVITGVFGYSVSKLITGPLGRLYRGAEIIRSGNLEYQVTEPSKDEIGELSKDVDAIVKDLRHEKQLALDLRRENTRYKEEAATLRETEEHYKNLFEYSNDAVFICDFEGKILDVNNKACEMLEYSKAELLEIPFWALHTEDELTKSKEAFKTGEETCSVRFESKFRKKDNQIIDIEISSSVVELKRGIMQHIVCNITDRKKLENDLKDSEEKFRTFMETASDLMYIRDKYGNLMYVNQSMHNTLGYTKAEMKGMNITDLQATEDEQHFKEMQRELILKGEITSETVWETKDRRKIFGEIKITAIYDKEMNFIGARGIFRDITERKKIEDAQRLAQLGKLAADVAHEVNNPITVISARAELGLMDESLDEETKESLKIILGQCEAAQNIVKRLLMFSKPSKGAFKEAEIHKAVEMVASLLEPEFMRKKIKLEKKITHPLPKLKIDEKQIQEVFMNLLRNAAEAMPEGGGITIHVKREGEHVRIDFSDTGSGISEEDMIKIFDPFFTTKETGTGLGLSVCYGIIQAHGGDLKYSSVPGKGTTATVLLPINYNKQNNKKTNKEAS